MPSRPAARHTSDRSPDGSAAASSSSRRVWSGRASSCRAEALLDPARTAAPRRAARTRPPAPPGVSPRGSSSSASGLPRVSATIWSRTRASSGPASAESSSARASLVAQPRRLRAPAARPAPSPGLAGREHQPDRVGRQPPRHEPQRLRRRLVQPLLVVDHADQRPLPGHLRQQAQHGQPDQEPVRRRAGGQAERGPQRIALRRRQLLERGPASARTADAARRRPAPSPTARPPRAPPGTRAPARPGSPAARSCPRPGRRAPPGPGSGRPGPPRRAGPARRVRCAGP